MFQQGNKYRTHFGFATTLSGAAVILFFLSSGLQSQSPAPPGLPAGVVPPASGSPPSAPPGPPGAPPLVPAATEPGRPKSDELLPVSQGGDDLQKVREEVRRLAEDRDQKRSEQELKRTEYQDAETRYQDAEVRYREAKKRLAEALEKNKLAIQRELDATKEELNLPSPAQGHSAASPYHPVGVPTPAGPTGVGPRMGTTLQEQMSGPASPISYKPASVDPAKLLRGPGN